MFTRGMEKFITAPASLFCPALPGSCLAMFCQLLFRALYKEHLKPVFVHEVDKLQEDRSSDHLDQWTIHVVNPLTNNENNGGQFAPNFRHEPPSDKGVEENQITGHTWEP